MRYWILFALPLFADQWLARVEPLMSPAEKKAYRSLSAKERQTFEEMFWMGRLISQEDYLQRAVFVDESYGSGKPGSGANTDRGRVHLSLGAPNRITRLASSRSFFPMEIWYYSEAPNLDIHYELQLLFFQRNGTGEYKLYSPSLKSIKDLLNPQTSIRGLFAVNDVVSEADIRTRLTLSPAESEVIDAAVSVARGIKGLGNEQILALVASPSRALSRDAKTNVTARLITEKPPLTTFQTTAVDGLPQIDLAIEVLVQKSVALEVLEGTVTLARYETALHLPEARQMRYEQRLALLPGDYRVLVTADGRTHPYALNVAATAPVAMLTGTLTSLDRARTPFEFRGSRVSASANAQVAVLEVAADISWRLRRGSEIVWNARSRAEGLVIQPIGDSHVPPGTYSLEAAFDGEVRAQSVRLGDAGQLPVISYNANLAPSERERALAHQYLVRGNAELARAYLERAQPDVATRVERCRVAALTGHYDEARAGLEDVLKGDPNNFEAIATLAYVETGLQDYRVAEQLYRRALEIRKSPAMERALAAVRTRF